MILRSVPSSNAHRINFNLLLVFQVSFVRAMKECIRAGGFLADMKDVAEKDELVKLAKRQIPRYPRQLWVAMATLGLDGRPVWLTSENPIPNRLWATGKPENTQNCTKTCGSLDWKKPPTGLRIGSCAYQRYFICEFP